MTNRLFKNWPFEDLTEPGDSFLVPEAKLGTARSYCSIWKTSTAGRGLLKFGFAEEGCGVRVTRLSDRALTSLEAIPSRRLRGFDGGALTKAGRSSPETKQPPTVSVAQEMSAGTVQVPLSNSVRRYLRSKGLDPVAASARILETVARDDLWSAVVDP